MSNELYAVVNPDGTFAGVPCESWEEARELANAREGRKIFEMVYDPGTLEDDALRVDSFYHHDDEKTWWDDLMKCYS